MNAIRFHFRFDTEKIFQELQAIAQSFDPIHSNKIKENNLNGTHLIIPTTEDQKNSKGYTYRFTPELDQSPYLQTVLDTFQCNKFMYRVHNLKAGGKISLHRDADRGLINNIVRIHIPVTTNDEVYFYVNGERIIMQNGECWHADITQLHEVENRSNTDRLQLMIDCDLNDWWANILEGHGVPGKQESEWDKHSLKELESIKENLLATGLEPSQGVIKTLDLAIALKTPPVSH